MALTFGVKLGSYEIQSLLGGGCRGCALSDKTLQLNSGDPGHYTHASVTCEVDRPDLVELRDGLRKAGLEIPEKGAVAAGRPWEAES
jgi:hypothetical protein